MIEQNALSQTEHATHSEIGMKEFFPSERANYDKPRVIFFPGAAADINEKLFDSLGKEISDIAHAKATVVTTRTETVEEDFLEREMAEVARRLEESGVTHVRLIGQSQGGQKAIVLAAILQAHDIVKVDNLGLIDSTGLYDQDPSTIFPNFNKDALIATPLEITRNTVANFARNHNVGGIRDIRRKIADNMAAIPLGVKSGLAVGGGIVRERLRSGRKGFKERSTNELEAMARKSRYLAELRMPIVMINGVFDPISNPNEIFPEDPSDEVILNLRDDSSREQYLKEQMFSSSPDVKAIVAKKLGNHGVLFLRPQQVLKDMIYLMDRQNERQTAANHDLQKAA